jgi:hypothetical protein
MAAIALRVFVMGFKGFLRGFKRTAGGLLACGFNAAAALTAVASYFYNSRLFLRSSVIVAFVYLFSTY